MDLDHTIRLETDLIGGLLAQGFQVIVLSHLKGFTEDLKQFYGLSLEHHYEFTNYHREGPLVSERGPQLVEYLREASLLKKGGSEQRTNAVHILRKALERMCKMSYSRSTGKPLPNKYQSMTASQLKDLVKGIISTEDLGKVNLILRYGDPASHDDQKTEPPTEGMVDSMISQMTNLIIKYVDSNFSLK
jgi:hypothetical protein